MGDNLKHYIDGQWVDSIGGRPHDVINPATESPCGRVILGSAADIDRAVSAAKRAFTRFAATSREERLALLNRVLDEYKARMPQLAASMSAEMGAPISFSATAQVGAGFGHIKDAIRALEAFTFEEDLGRGVRVVHEPIGVVGMITPWNWPLNQIMAKIGPALAAGNCMVLKPSEECPGCATIVAEALDAAGVPPGVFNLVHGLGADAGAALSAHPDVDMLSFTGSTRAGIAVATAAAATVKRVHQELGGNAPNIVLPGADLDAVLPPTVAGVLRNSGQSCIAPTRLLIPHAEKAAVEAAVSAIVGAATVGDPASEGPHIGPLVNKAQFDKVQALIQSAIDEGATLLVGGTGRPDGIDTGYFVRPTVFSDVTPSMRIYRQEIFGPVATLTAYDDLNQAVTLANDTEYGLSATISGDPALARTIIGKVRAGVVSVNDWSPSGGPFGGYKQSGNGREGGRWGLADFMEVKTVSGA